MSDTSGTTLEPTAAAAPTGAAASSANDTILLIHGLWMTPRSWEHWVERYTKAGQTVLAPAWPGLDAEVEALRNDPSLANSDPLGTGWFFKMRVNDTVEMDQLLDAAAYDALVKQG